MQSKSLTECSNILHNLPTNKLVLLHNVRLYTVQAVFVTKSFSEINGTDIILAQTQLFRYMKLRVMCILIWRN